jgi:hypothetical protein
MRQFIASHAKAPMELVFDVGATHWAAAPSTGAGHFRANWDNHCNLPLCVFAGQNMQACLLLPSDRHSASLVSTLIKRRHLLQL